MVEHLPNGLKERSDKNSKKSAYFHGKIIMKERILNNDSIKNIIRRKNFGIKRWLDFN